MYFDTSVLGALADREERHRLALTRALLRDAATGVHIGIVSNIVNEELEQASADVRETIREGLRSVEFEVVVEDEESRVLFGEYLAAKMSLLGTEMICAMWQSRRWRGLMRSFRGTFDTW